MSTTTVGLFLRHLALSEEVSRLGTVSDRDLLTTYDRERDQVAFTELMRRHGPMVLRTCCRVLDQESDAEDAFQATFLLLARKAGRLCREVAGPLSLGGWLHHVAYQTAVNVLSQSTRRRLHERRVAAMSPYDPDPVAKAGWNEIRPILDAELDALPDEPRRLLIACYLQGKTYTKAAVELGLPRGSVAWRLEQARALLAERLVRRGITLSVPLLAVLLEETAKGAGVSAVLLVYTVEAARVFPEQAAGLVSDHVAQLVKSGLAKMARGWMVPGVALASLVGLLGAGLIACQTLIAWPERAPSPVSGNGISPIRDETGETPVERKDRYGDPLPPGALARLGTTRLRQMTGVRSLAFTRDGKGLITAGGWEPVQLWDLASGRILRHFGDGRNVPVYAVALSADGRILAGRVIPTGGVCLWEAATGTLLRRLEGRQLMPGRLENPAALAFSPDDKTVASGDNGTLHLWEVATGREMWVANRLPIALLVFSADGKTLIWTGRRGGVHLWDAAAGKELRHWDDDNKRPISALALAPHGRLLVAYGSLPGKSGGLARLWDTTTGKEVRQLAAGEADITAAVFSLDGKYLATGAPHGPIRLWDVATDKELRRCDGREGVQCLAFAPDGKTLASGSGGQGSSRDQRVHLWDVETGREVRRLIGHQSTVCSTVFTPDGKDIVSASWDGSLCVWNAASAEQRRRIVLVDDEYLHGNLMVGIGSAVSPDGKTLLTAALERSESTFFVKVRKWDRKSGDKLPGWFRELGKSAPRGMTISPNGATVACATNVAHLWEGETGKELAHIAGDYQAFSADGKLVASASLPQRREEPATVALWDAVTGAKLCSVPVPAGRVHRLLFSPDGRMLAAVNDGAGKQPSAIHLWPLSRDEAQKSAVHVGPSRVFSKETLSHGLSVWTFSPDGRTLAI